MIHRQLSELLPVCQPQSITGNPDKLITGICYNSNNIKPGQIFTALRGIHTDGHKYIVQATAAGAAAIVCESPVHSQDKNITYIQVANTRRALSALAAAFYGYPAQKMKTIGVTGTDGKSTTVWFIQQLLEGCGKTSGFLSTTGYQTGDTVQKNPFRQSTPEAPEINTILAGMAAKGKTYAVLEATSHGLSLLNCRLADIQFNAAVFTNISHEHLEFHGTLEQYRFDKANLFRQLYPGNQVAYGVVNLDDTHYDYFRQATTRPIYTYSLHQQAADMYAIIQSGNLTGTDCLIQYQNQQFPVRLNIPGTFNIANLLAALLTVHKLTNIEWEELLSVIPRLRPPTGRMHSINQGQPFHVIVDYAHSPGSFEKIFNLIRPLAPGRIISVFGSAGERDKLKRPMQGKIAADFSELVILTDEDPRLEDPMQILEEIAAGCQGLERDQSLYLIPDRTQAIRHAFSLANPGDTVLILGKGHESSIIYADGPQPWDEIAVCEQLLQEYL